MKNVLTILFSTILFFVACSPSQETFTTENNAPQVHLVKNTLDDDRQVSLDEALKAIEDRQGVFARMLSHGSMFVGLYTPKVEDKQSPHKQDEVYIIMEGTGEFLNGTTTTTFKPGDVIFVPAAEEHRFLNFSEDFKAWVVFYGPEGGEQE